MAKIPMEKAVNGVVSFLSSEASKIRSMQDKFLMYAALGAVKANPCATVGKYVETLEMLGVVSDDMVDLDTLKSALESAFANVPNFNALGFTFTESDVPVLLRHMGG